MSEFNNGNPRSDRPHARMARAKKVNPRSKKAVDALIEDNGWKPIEEWDLQELARGKPKGLDGKFTRGPRPKWITEEVLAQVRKRHKQLVNDNIREMAEDAIALMHRLMNDDEFDENGKPVTPAATKFAAAKYILDQTVGAPIAKVEAEINHKVSFLMNAVIVNPDGTPSYPGVENFIEGEVVEEEDDDDEL